MANYVPLLTIAGSDSSGGAGIQADIKTMSALGCYAMSAITAITAQNTCGVTGIQGITPDMVKAQIDAVCSDIVPKAVKTGMLYSDAIAGVVADAMQEHGLYNIVVDPVMVSTSGSKLLEDSAVDVIVRRLFPLATLVTPNKAEAKVLTGYDSPEEQARVFHAMGVRAVLLKGGDTADTDFKRDYLCIAGNMEPICVESHAVPTVNTHGTGCTLSSAIAAYLAMGCGLVDAVKRAKQYITEALDAGSGVSVGHGHGPVNHFYNPLKLKIEQ